jgi:predicted GNAT family acetyltransferase
MENHRENLTLQIHHNKERQRFEVDLKNGNCAYLEYRWSGKSLAIMHLEVSKEWQHAGIPEKIVHCVLEFAKQEQVMIKPFCPYIATYIDQNPQYRSLIESSFRPLT